MKNLFPKDFIWGAATAAYQIEGAVKEGGRGESIWDRFSHIPGKTFNGDTGDIACNHYHLFKEDIKLMKEIGLKSYRFSISWPRIFPEGKGEPNPEGIAFYRELINCLIENGIEPAITLYHWDLPQKLQDVGGWANREVTDYFAQYATYVFKEFGSLVPIWITLNEPWVVSFVGNSEGRHAPGITDYSTALQVSYNLLLAHGKAVRAYRELGYKGKIGVTLNMNPSYAASDSSEDIEAASRFNMSHNRWFADPILKGSFPKELLSWYSGKVVLPVIKNEDLKIISEPIDFLGINNYFSSFIKNNPAAWPLQFSAVTTGKNKTEMGWEINPEGIHDLLVYLHKEYAGIDIIITENGAAFNDMPNLEGKVEDENRLTYLCSYLHQINLAIQEGVNLKGYYAWSLFDNYEWAYGYAKRFGMIYVDYATQKRTIKKSGYWYKDVINNNGF
ncbi:beta-glucosidase [Clostridium sp. 19966]|uniref:GH1 family beta-glucosidase n=1 Tax=Clostridium sp. 19966 TaxID=2768166 RepID=UPI0028DE2DBC|nr:GH1 family beta-glucosidase [Clostridium sp. 19966]MDT8715089.1 beta-glucosidase [Clostridium sp. 19966]